MHSRELPIFFIDSVTALNLANTEPIFPEVINPNATPKRFDEYLHMYTAIEQLNTYIRMAATGNEYSIVLDINDPIFDWIGFLDLKEFLEGKGFLVDVYDDRTIFIGW